MNSHRIRLLQAASVAIILATTSPSPLHAQSESIRRTLGVHTFVPSTLLGDPFVGTFVRNITGAGSAVGLQIPKIDLNEQVIEYRDADLTFLTLGMEYQQAVNEWLAFRIGFSGGARLGTSLTALISEGVTAQFGGTLGATAKVYRNEKFIVSATADILPGAAYQISILDFAKEIVNEGYDSTTSLVSKSSPYRYRFGGVAAYSVSPWLGFQATSTVGPARTASNATETEIRVGAGASMDFETKGTPIGVVVGYLYTDPSAGADVVGGAGIFNLGVYYTGQKRFVVGLDTQFTSADQAHGTKKLDVATGRIVLRYDLQ